jgi:hypothetical protein
MTPYFMKLVSIDNSTKIDIENICDDAGQIFPGTEEREKYITDFYSNLYSKPIGPERNEQAIDDFLSDISNHPAVLDSKISDHERARLDSDLRIEEFDQAVKEIKSNTAPELDGISNRFIKKSWDFFPGTIVQLRHILSRPRPTDRKFQIRKSPTNP